MIYTSASAMTAAFDRWALLFLLRFFVFFLFFLGAMVVAVIFAVDRWALLFLLRFFVLFFLGDIIRLPTAMLVALTFAARALVCSFLVFGTSLFADAPRAIPESVRSQDDPRRRPFPTPACASWSVSSIDSTPPLFITPHFLMVMRDASRTRRRFCDLIRADSTLRSLLSRDSMCSSVFKRTCACANALIAIVGFIKEFRLFRRRNILSRWPGEF